jgi:glycerol-3-phosphate dehydrogenase
VRHEGALDADDLLQRRTRIGLIPADLELARPAADQALRDAG